MENIKSNYKMIPFSIDLDLTSFYEEAERRGYYNNTSSKVMVDCFRNEREKQVWILYDNDNPIGSVGAHSFDDVMGPNSYRILTRVCSFGNARPSKGMLTARRLAIEHQTFNDQFFLPTCIEWAGAQNNLYVTSNEESVGNQRLVHKIYFPTLEKIGIAKRIKDVYYRYTYQTVWQIFPDKFYENLNKYERWKLNEEV